MRKNKCQSTDLVPHMGQTTSTKHNSGAFYGFFSKFPTIGPLFYMGVSAPGILTSLHTRLKRENLLTRNFFCFLLYSPAKASIAS